jgi:hypothetical protein
MKSNALLALGACVGALLVARPAFAQAGASPGRQTATPLTLRGDRGGDAGALSGYSLSAPLRLSLEGGVFPQAGLFPNCISREDAAGNSVGGIPVHHYSEVWLTPRLVLSGFTQLGCPIDGGVGGTATFVAPIRDSLRLVLGAGFYGAPGRVPLAGGLPGSMLRGSRGDSPVNTAAQVDLVWNTKSGQSYHLGLESRGLAIPGIRFGGGF